MNPKWQPALFGGLVVGVLSALPVVSVGNFCCCLWVVAGGVVAAYVLQQNQDAPITQADGALSGFQAGTVGAIVYLVLAIPIAFLMAPIQRQVFERLADDAASMPPEFREYLRSYTGGPIFVVAGFISMLFMGAIFSTIGGLVGAVVFKKKPPVEPPPEDDV